MNIFNRITHFNFDLYIHFVSLRRIKKHIVNEFPTTTNQNNIVAAAIMGGYFGLFLLAKISMAMSGSKPVVVVAAAASPNGAIPSVDSDEFGAFLDSEENVNMFVDSFEKE